MYEAFVLTVSTKVSLICCFWQFQGPVWIINDIHEVTVNSFALFRIGMPYCLCHYGQVPETELNTSILRKVQITMLACKHASSATANMAMLMASACLNSPSAQFSES